MIPRINTLKPAGGSHTYANMFEILTQLVRAGHHFALDDPLLQVVVLAAQ